MGFTGLAVSDDSLIPMISAFGFHAAPLPAGSILVFR
jgi:hypothetical protein